MGKSPRNWDLHLHTLVETPRFCRLTETCERRPASSPHSGSLFTRGVRMALTELVFTLRQHTLSFVRVPGSGLAGRAVARCSRFRAACLLPSVCGRAFIGGNAQSLFRGQSGEQGEPREHGLVGILASPKPPILRRWRSEPASRVPCSLGSLRAHETQAMPCP